jgi:hypothetical protein
LVIPKDNKSILSKAIALRGSPQDPVSMDGNKNSFKTTLSKDASPQDKHRRIWAISFQHFSKATALRSIPQDPVSMDGNKSSFTTTLSKAVALKAIIPPDTVKMAKTGFLMAK